MFLFRFVFMFMVFFVGGSVAYSQSSESIFEGTIKPGNLKRVSEISTFSPGLSSAPIKFFRPPEEGVRSDIFPIRLDFPHPSNGVRPPEIENREPPSLQGEIRWVVDGTPLHFSAIVPKTIDSKKPSRTPVVFLNYDETITDGEVGPGFSNIGSKAIPLFPNSRKFSIGSSHANGSNRSVLKTGVRFSNHSATETISLEIFWPPNSLEGKLLFPCDGKNIFHRKFPAPPRLIIAVRPKQTVNIPVVQAEKHSGSNPRDGSRLAMFKMEVLIKGGDSKKLEVQDVACHPGNSIPNPRPHSGGETYHHQGIFKEQILDGPPLVLSENTVVSLAIQGTQRGHNAHYEVSHRFLITFPPGKEPKKLVFLGTGGYALPVINGQRRCAVRLSPEKDSNGKTIYQEIDEGGSKKKYAVIRQFKSFSCDFSEAKKWLIPIGAKNGATVYALDIIFKPRDNGNLGILAKY